MTLWNLTDLTPTPKPFVINLPEYHPDPTINERTDRAKSETTNASTAVTTDTNARSSIIISIDDRTHIGKKLWSHLAKNAHNIPATWKHIDDYSKSENFQVNVGNHIFNLFHPLADSKQKTEIINKLVKKILGSQEVLHAIINRKEWPAVEPKYVVKFKWSSIRKIVGSTEAIWPVIEEYCASKDFCHSEGFNIINFFYNKAHTTEQERVMKFVIKSTFCCQFITNEILKPDWRLLNTIDDFPFPARRYALITLYGLQPKKRIYQTIKSLLDQKKIDQAIDILLETPTKRFDLWIMIIKEAIKNETLISQTISSQTINDEIPCNSTLSSQTINDETLSNPTLSHEIIQQIRYKLIQSLCEVPIEHNWKTTRAKAKNAIAKLILNTKTFPEIFSNQIIEQKSFYLELFPTNPPTGLSIKLKNKLWPEIVARINPKGDLSKWEDELKYLNKKNLWITWCTLSTLAHNKKSKEKNQTFLKTLTYLLFDNFHDTITNIPKDKLTADQIKSLLNLESYLQDKKIFNQVHSFLVLTHHQKDDYKPELLNTLNEALGDQFIPTLEIVLDYFYQNPKHWFEHAEAKKMFLNLITTLKEKAIHIPQKLPEYKSETIVTLINILKSGKILNNTNLLIVIETALKIPPSMLESNELWETLAEHLIKLTNELIPENLISQYREILKRCCHATKVKVAEKLLSEGFYTQTELLLLTLPSFCIEIEKKRGSVNFTPTVRNDFIKSLKNLPQHPVIESELLLIDTLLRCDQDDAIAESIKRVNVLLTREFSETENITPHLTSTKPPIESSSINTNFIDTSAIVIKIGKSIAKRPDLSQSKLFLLNQEITKKLSLSNLLGFIEGIQQSKNVNLLITILSQLVNKIVDSDIKPEQIQKIHTLIDYIFDQKLNKRDRDSLIAIWKFIKEDMPKIDAFPNKTVQRLFTIKLLESAFKDLDTQEIEEVLKVVRPNILALQAIDLPSEEIALKTDDIALFYAAISISNTQTNLIATINNEIQNKTLAQQIHWPNFNVIKTTISLLTGIPKNYDQTFKLQSRIENLLYLLANESLKNKLSFAKEHQSFELYIKRFHQENQASRLSQHELINKALEIDYNQSNIHLLYHHTCHSILQQIRNPGATCVIKIVKQIMSYVDVCIKLQLQNFRNGEPVKKSILSSIQSIIIELVKNAHLIKNTNEVIGITNEMQNWIEQITSKFSQLKVELERV